MKDNFNIEKKLKNIENGSFITKKINQDKSFLEERRFSGNLCGKGMTSIYTVFPGVEAYMHCFFADKISFSHNPMKNIIQINHCRSGRLGWKMENGLSIYMGNGDLSLHMLDACAESEMSLPLGFYEGISVSIDINVFSKNLPSILEETKIDIKQLSYKYCGNGKNTAITRQDKIDYIFSALYNLPQNLRIPYFRLKVQELLLFLSISDFSEEQELNQYHSEQVELIKEIHNQLINNLDKRFTIEELSKKYLINTSSLKSIFKSVYGLPIAAYMKEYRMKYAAELLSANNNNIANIAAVVGYSSQSKFTKAFKDIMQISPAAYRKQYRK